MTPVLWVMLGGGIGSAIRYLISRSLPMQEQSFPWSTFLVNLTGCLAIGALWGLLEKRTIDPNVIRWFWMAGVCGGFTTFSAFSLESLQLLQQQRWSLLLPYILGSVSLGLLATWAGWQWLRP